MSNSLEYSNYQIRKQFFKAFGGAFRIYDPMENLVFFADMKAFKLKEDIRLYTGEDKSEELLIIKARNVIDFSATYDIFDSKEQIKIGAMRRKGLKSLLKDEWIILDSLDQEIGYIKEDNMLMAVLRRVMSEFLPNLIPQSFVGHVREFPVLEFKQNFNPFTLRLNLDFSQDQNRLLDRRIGIAAALLLCAIDGRQK